MPNETIYNVYRHTQSHEFEMNGDTYLGTTRKRELLDRFIQKQDKFDYGLFVVDQNQQIVLDTSGIPVPDASAVDTPQMPKTKQSKSNNMGM